MTTTPKPVELMTVPTAAKRLSLSPSMVYKLMSEGELQSVQIGKSRRIASDSLDAFIEAHRA